MSGVSCARKPQQKEGNQQEKAAGLMGSVRVIELQLVAFIMVFSASGLVPLHDLIFPALASVYLLLLSRFAFPSLGTTTSTSFQEIFQFYRAAGTTVGLFLPLAYALGGFARGDQHALHSATPHLFLLSFQILTEHIISGLSLCSPPVRALVPLLYTVRRIFLLIDWIQDEWINKTLPGNAQFKDVTWYWFGKGLSVANMTYFSIHLFGFLIPQFLPGAFERWDSSPNRELIHQAIEAFEEHLSTNEQYSKKNRNKKKDKISRRNGIVKPSSELHSFIMEEEKILPVIEDDVFPENEVLMPEIADFSSQNGGNEVEESSSLKDMVAPLPDTTVLVRGTVANIHKGLARKVLPDVLGLFNSRLWNLWSPNV